MCPDLGPRCPEAPAHLDAAEAAEWRRVAPALWQAGALSVLDVAALSAYCVWRVRWERLERALEGAPTIVESHSHRITNPLFRAARDAARMMALFAREFGLSPASRSKVAGLAVRPTVASKFDGLVSAD
jgi:P27 family predicted phage terminase small subunit